MTEKAVALLGDDRNSVSVYQGGKFRIRGGNLPWEDLRFPAANLRVNPANSKPDVEPNTGCYLFDATTPERITAQVQFPHAWKEGSVIVPHVHWAKSTSAAGNVTWRFEYRMCPIGGILDEDWTQVDATAVASGTPDDNTAYRHLITSFGEIDMTGHKISDMMLVRIWRQADAAEDTYAGDAVLAEFDIHYQIDSFGSIHEFIKQG